MKLQADMSPWVRPEGRVWLAWKGRFLTGAGKLRLQCLFVEEDGLLMQCSDWLVGDLGGNAVCGGVVQARSRAPVTPVFDL